MNASTFQRVSRLHLNYHMILWFSAISPHCNFYENIYMRRSVSIYEYIHVRFRYQQQYKYTYQPPQLITHIKVKNEKAHHYCTRMPPTTHDYRCVPIPALVLLFCFPLNHLTVLHLLRDFLSPSLERNCFQTNEGKSPIYTRQNPSSIPLVTD